MDLSETKFRILHLRLMYSINQQTHLKENLWFFKFFFLYLLRLLSTKPKDEHLWFYLAILIGSFSNKNWAIKLDIRGAYDKFPDIFRRGFKIVVDIWKFSMLLLYILWDDWPIFMISGSNQKLQQQLEYTLLKPDCHSWRISKMQSDTLEERYVLKFYF